MPNSYDNRGWELTITEQRRQLQKLLRQSPSLRHYFQEVFSDCWQFALSQARKDYPKGCFFDEWEWLGGKLDPSLLYDYPTIESLVEYLS